MLDIVFQIPTDTLNSPYSSDKVHQCYIDTKGNVDYNIWIGGDYYEKYTIFDQIILVASLSGQF